eukprot:scaffold3022_cov150-Pinguiococcus_pyrenoidosus.AAC.2
MMTRFVGTVLASCTLRRKLLALRGNLNLGLDGECSEGLVDSEVLALQLVREVRRSHNIRLLHRDGIEIRLGDVARP